MIRFRADLARIASLPVKRTFAAARRAPVRKRAWDRNVQRALSRTRRVARRWSRLPARLK